ncbi:hypothetical protein NQ318_003934 [Aromia moschata]|uniref:Chemosensory protein n=1 Tax=Aromia moschata TaxID=1265417 RepID=A0AAV8Z9I8_9CUCU|nr:hypothetical protein NQ318_003934 [Aromia moschata]
MKFAVVLFFVASLCGVALAKPDGYTTKYDNIDLQEIIKNEAAEELRGLPAGQEEVYQRRRGAQNWKKVLPEAIKEDCAKCNETQKNGAFVILTHLLKNKREWYNELEAIYDSDGSYRKRYAEKYADELKKEGITI